jgi:translation initiation factor IF-2
MTLIVTKGLLKIGSILIVGDEYTKIKNIYDDRGKQIELARPGDAVQIIGIGNIPLAGDFIF